MYPLDNVTNFCTGTVPSFLKLASMSDEISILICTEPISWFQMAANGANAKELRIGLTLSWVFFLHVSFIKKLFLKSFIKK